MTQSVDQVAAAAHAAANRIGDIVYTTPLERSPVFSDAAGAEVYFKLENLQHTGSFKLRGAANRLMTLSDEQRMQGCVAASSGNHGAGVAYAMQKLGLTGVIFVPEFTSAAKIDAIRQYGGDVRIFGTDGLDTEIHARAYAAEHGMRYVPPYNDPEVIAGQGTCGVEIAVQAADIDTLFVAVGGGGLISGVGSVLKTHNPAMRIYGCQPSASAVMAKSIGAGRILELPSMATLSDGTAGGIETDSITFELCRDIVDDFILVSENEIAAAMRQYMDAHEHVIEGAAGVAIAALLARPDLTRKRKIGVIICGGNVSEATLKSITIST